MAQIKPFRFSLAKVSKADNQILSDLLEFLSSSGLQETFPLSIRKSLNQYLPDLRYYLERIETLSYHDFFVSLPNPSSVAVIGLEPFKEKGLIELDPALSFTIIEKLLGGKGDTTFELRPFTETEQGVVEFLLLKLLAEIHKEAGNKPKLHFRLERMVLEPAHLKAKMQDDLPMVCLKVHVALSNKSGFVKIYLPAPWILEGFLKDLPGDAKSHSHKALKKSLRRFDFLPIDMKCGLGEAEVGFSDFEKLEEGDVILFDETHLQHKKEGWRGGVKLFVGEGEAGGLTAIWEGFSGGGLCRITGQLAGGKTYG